MAGRVMMGFMNYHNFASRLSVQRLPAESTKDASKPATKKSRRQGRRRVIVVGPLLPLLCVLGFSVTALAEGDAPSGRVATPQHVDVGSYIIPLVGLAVVLLRLPVLWRRDIQC